MSAKQLAWRAEFGRASGHKSTLRKHARKASCDRGDLESCTVVTLKEMLKVRRLSTAGNKQALINRLQGVPPPPSYPSPPLRMKIHKSSIPPPPSYPPPPPPQRPFYDFNLDYKHSAKRSASPSYQYKLAPSKPKLSAAELQQARVARGHALVAANRKRHAKNSNECLQHNVLELCTVEQLKAQLKAAGLPASGLKSQLISRLRMFNIDTVPTLRSDMLAQLVASR